MNDKAILMVRTSTEKQENSMDEQEKELYRFALEDGILSENLTLIPEFGISGRKKGKQISATTSEGEVIVIEEERSGIKKMKQLIESDPEIKTVYVWEVSRLTRRMAVGAPLLEYFEDRKVNLKVLSPRVSLLNNDGTVNEGQKTTITLLIQLAENEMRNKLSRFARSRNARMKQGYYTGGYVLYGYKVVDKKLEINPEEAEVVKMIFTMYLSGKYSYRSLTKELRAMGYFTDSTFYSANQRVSKILTNTAYAGKPSVESRKNAKGKIGNLYPPIITMDILEKCDAIASKNRKDNKKDVTNIYYANKILRCPVCGKVMLAHIGGYSYKCDKCDSKMSVSINIIDSVLWACAAPLYIEKIQKKEVGQKEYYESQIVLLEQKAEVASKEIYTLYENIDKIEYRAFVENIMDIAKADKFVADINKKIEAKNKEIEEIQNKIQTFRNLLLEYTGDYLGEKIDEVSQITDDKLRYDIIHQMINWASIERVNNSKRFYFCTIYDYLDNKHEYLLNTNARKIYKGFTPEGIGIEEMEGAFIERFKNKNNTDPVFLASKERALQARKERMKTDPEFAKLCKEKQIRKQALYRERKKLKQELERKKEETK